MTDVAARLEGKFNGLVTQAIAIPLDVLGEKIMSLISDVGMLHYVSKGDLRVFGQNATTPPENIRSAMRWGTKLFDAIYYFAAPATERPAISAGEDKSADLDQIILQSKRRLLWTALFLMMRGSYPQSEGQTLGQDIPAFIVNIAGMNESPANVARGLASFNIQNVPAGWIRYIDWTGFAPEIRQRLALGLAGYRLLGPFKVYNVKPDAPDDVKAAFEWVRNVARAQPDYAILSATRSASLVSRLGSWNKALGNLILLAFTADQINEMVTVKILFSRPQRDPRSDTWRSWADGGSLELRDPINL